MKHFILPVIFLCVYIDIHAQNNYNMTNFRFSHSVYSDISGTGNDISMTDKENGSSTTAQEIGFTFQYNGTAFTQFTIHADGILRLGNEAPGAATLINASPDQSLAGIFTSTDARFQNVIMPLFTDLVQGTDVPQYHTITTGTAPNRTCTIQWKNLRDANSPTVLNRNQYSNMEFQVKLYETSNDIEFVYGNFTPTANIPVARFATCGIKSGSTSFLGFYRISSVIAYDKSALLNPSANVRILSDFRFSNLKIPAAGFSTRFFGRVTTDVSVAKLFYDSITPAGTQTPGQIVALIKNDGLQPVSSVVVNFAISGANTHNYQTTINTLAANDSVFVDIPAFSMANTGSQNIHVSATVSDDARAANNNRSAVQVVSKSHLQRYDFSNSGNIGVGFNGSGFVAVKVLGQGIRKIAQVRIPFNTYRNSVRFRIYEDGGTGGGLLRHLYTAHRSY